MVKRLLVLALVAMVSPAVLGKIIVDDHFDDDMIGTNIKGTGSGFNSWDIGWSGNVTEANSKVTLNGPVHGGSRSSIASKEGANIGSGISRFEFKGVSFAVGNTNPGTCARDCIGVKEGDAAWDFDEGLPTGFWIQLENTSLSLASDPGSAGGWNGTSVLFYESSTDVKTVLATWSFDTLNWYPGAQNLAPVLDLTLDISSTGYSLTIEGDSITLLSGAMSGTFANELTTGYASAYQQSENPGIDILIDQIVITQDAPAPVAASHPNPGDGEEDVFKDVILSWMPGLFASTHDVYLGTSFDDVANATRTEPLDVLVSKNQSDATCNPGRLEFGTTYYWRVDEVNAPAAGGTIYKGEVWSFTVEPYSIAITDVDAVADSTFAASSAATKTCDRSGLDLVTDLHSTAATDMWVSAQTAFPHWIKYSFDRLYKLDQMWVWNSNQTMEVVLGLGAKDVLVQYSTDDENWEDLGDFVFVRAPGIALCAPDTKVPFGGVAAKYVKLTITSNWGGFPTLQQGTLSEVRFFYIPVVAREPLPVPGATNLHPQVTMSWRSGHEADSHEVYVGTDVNAVAASTTPTATTPQASYEASLNLEQTYYWKVVEVNQTKTPSGWPSDVWSFSTAKFINVDDFESYTNKSPHRVFQTWIDGTGFSPNEFFPNGHNGNGTGSLVGYDPEVRDVMETTYFYDGGQQSMPLYYDNSTGTRVSEAIRTLDPAEDTTNWTRHGLTTLVLWFRGNPANAAAPLYVKINNTTKRYNNGAASTGTAIWKPFQIDLASVPVSDLQNVRTLTIGVGDGSAGGTGTMLVDEIRLYATPPAVAVPTDPGTNGLEALYAMEGNVQDSSGKGRNGTANGDPGYVDGPAGFGKALAFDGINDYVDLSIGNLLSTLGGSTFAARVNFSNTGGGWQRVFDFGTGTTNYMFLTPRQGTTGATRCAIRTAAINEQGANGPVTLPTGWHHMAVVFDDAAMRIRLYVDGVEVASGATVLLPRDMGVTTQNWLGRSQWTGDGYYTGSLDDFRIYSRPLSEGEVRYLAGDR
jgi:hypothetical protein